MGFRFDNWGRVELPASIRDGINNPLIVFVNRNNQQTIGNIATASPERNVETIYFASPSNPTGRIPILEINNTGTGNQIYISPTSNALAYWLEDGGASGMYILNLDNGLSGRIAAIDSIPQRGIFSAPEWSPDGEELLLTLDNGYALDIYAYQRDGTGRRNITNSGSYDFHPVWSPDGRYIAFVSDRQTCPSWYPGDVGACDALTQETPIGGTVHLLDVTTGEIRQLSDVFVTEAPRWINNRLLVFAGGNQLDLLNPERTLWLANIPANLVTQVALAGDEDALYLSDTWSPDGSAVIVQRVKDGETTLIALSSDGQLLRDRSANLTFPRFGVAMAWSATGQRIALGGIGGQCPYGIRILETANFDIAASGNPPPSMCEPIFSTDGQMLAFMGVNPRVDGRVDVYSATANGFNAQNMTIDLRGSMTLIGWIGGSAP